MYPRLECPCGAALPESASLLLSPFEYGFLCPFSPIFLPPYYLELSLFGLLVKRRDLRFVWTCVQVSLRPFLFLHKDTAFE